MSESRLELLQQYYAEDPTDPFNLYALALEYQKTDLTKSCELFDKLLTDFPEYLPTYYHAAKLKTELNQHEAALGIYKKGIDIARDQNERKALQELQSAYNELLFDLDN